MDKLQPLSQALKRIRPLYRTINRLRGTRLHDPTTRANHQVLGSDYGAWAVIPSLLSSSSVVYSVGVGQDISFDTALIDLAGCCVHAFDPTPTAITWLENRRVSPLFCYHQIGLSNDDGEVAFQLPSRSNGASYSLQQASDRQQSGFVMCKVSRLTTIMRGLGHSDLDVLKMDIEGFEYPVLEDLLTGEIRPRQLLVEFHHGMYGHTAAQTEQSVRRIIQAGYAPYWISDVGREYAFVHKSC